MLNLTAASSVPWGEERRRIGQVLQDAVFAAGKILDVDFCRFPRSPAFALNRAGALRFLHGGGPVAPAAEEFLHIPLNVKKPRRPKSPGLSHDVWNLGLARLSKNRAK